MAHQRQLCVQKQTWIRLDSPSDMDDLFNMLICRKASTDFYAIKLPPAVNWAGYLCA